MPFGAQQQLHPAGASMGEQPRPAMLQPKREDEGDDADEEEGEGPADGFDDDEYDEEGSSRFSDVKGGARHHRGSQPHDDAFLQQHITKGSGASTSAAAAGAGSCFQCPYCEKRYTGKHARSIWRRHLQDKHNIPLSQQPRRTRWDGDLNRPKNAEERRQRMLESKRRWARKKRLAEKGIATDNASDEEDEDEDEDDKESSERASAAPSSQPQQRVAKRAHDEEAVASASSSSSMAYNPNMPHASSSSSSNPQINVRPPQSTHTHPMMPAFFESGAFPTMPFVANNNNNISSAAASARSMDKSSLAAAREFGKSHDAVAMRATISSPRQALAQLDGNRSLGHQQQQHAQQGQFQIKDETRAVYDKQQQQQQMQNKTPVNRFSQLYPTPPSMGDASGESRRYSADGFFNMAQATQQQQQLYHQQQQHKQGALKQHQTQQQQKASNKSRPSQQPLLSPPTSAHTESSPSNTKHNPFSLDRHRVSPRAAAVPPGTMGVTPARSLLGAKQTPAALATGNKRHGHSNSNANGSPTARRLPSLARTPLFNDASPLTLNRAFGASNGSAIRNSGRTITRAKVETPTEDHMELMLGFTPLKGRHHQQQQQPTPSRRKESSERHQVQPDHLSDSEMDNDIPTGSSAAALFSSPAHPNLTQSLGLAPHRSGLASISATPFGKLQPLLGNGLGSTASLPWPDSVVRPSMYRRRSDERLMGDDDDDDDDDNTAPQGGDGSPARKRSRTGMVPAILTSLKSPKSCSSTSASSPANLTKRPVLAEKHVN